MVLFGPPRADSGGRRRDITPWDAPGAAHQGERIYAANGCVYCHTQQVRPANSGADIIRGWGTAKDESDDKAPPIIRRTYPRDYIWQGQVFLGNSREGADLSNVAERFTDAAVLYRYLYDPYILNPHSSMPAYRFLFIERKISGLPSKDALALTGDDAPPAGYEIVPTDEASRLSPISFRSKKITISPTKKALCPLRPTRANFSPAMKHHENPDLLPPETDHTDALKPGAPDFVETPDIEPLSRDDREQLPVWLYLICGFALFMTGSSFTGLGIFGQGLYDQGPGGPALATSSGTQAAEVTDPLVLGRKVYNNNCANCHHADGLGQPGTYPALVGSTFVVGSKERLAAILLQGLSGPLTVNGGSYGSAVMPAWNSVLTPDKIANVMTYIRASWGNKANAVTEDEVSKARAKFASHAAAFTQAELLKIAPDGPDPSDKK